MRTPPLLVRLLIYSALIGFSVALCLQEASADITPPKDVIKLDAATFTWRSYTSPGRDALIAPYEHSQAIELKLDTDVLRYFFIDSRVYGIQDEGQYRGIGLNVIFGVRLTEWWRIEGRNHTSEHMLDAARSNGFPVYDSWAMVFDIYRAHPTWREALF